MNKSLLSFVAILQKEKDPDKFLLQLEHVPANTNYTEFTHIVTTCIYNHLIAATSEGDYATGKKMVQAFPALLEKIGYSNKYGDEFTATAVSLAQLFEDEEVKNIVFRQIMPLYIGHPRLAYNLACFFAVKDEKRSMFQYIRIAMDLGRKKEEFLKDSDFSSFYGNPEFRALLGLDTGQMRSIPVTSDVFTPMVHELNVLAQKIKEAGNQPATVLIEEYISKLKKLMNNDWSYALGKDIEIEESLLPKQYRDQREKVLVNWEAQLGHCAYRYRSSKEGSQENKDAIALYHKTFAEMLRIQGKVFVIPPDTSLLDKDMPKAYQDFWK